MVTTPAGGGGLPGQKASPFIVWGCLNCCGPQGVTYKRVQNICLGSPSATAMSCRGRVRQEPATGGRQKHQLAAVPPLPSTQGSDGYLGLLNADDHSRRFRGTRPCLKTCAPGDLITFARKRINSRVPVHGIQSSHLGAAASGAGGDAEGENDSRMIPFPLFEIKVSISHQQSMTRTCRYLRVTATAGLLSMRGSNIWRWWT
ncbi:hypothetical protein LXA43DRAFT_1023724 [Ganoderma leucocontextum]|nr:hypothetical protein LXA43DRAFT_1023724 [Ganoderma leucocontextum]